MSQGRFCGERLEELRKDKGLTQDELGAILEVSGKTISHYENNLTNPKVDTLLKMSVLFDVSTDYLLGFIDDAIPVSQKYSLTLSREYPTEMIKDLENYLTFLKSKYIQNK